jgi:hypothetical protein
MVGSVLGPVAHPSAGPSAGTGTGPSAGPVPSQLLPLLLLVWPEFCSNCWTKWLTALLLVPFQLDRALLPVRS